MEDNKPLVSVGMPVYNGEQYIKQALDSLLAQDYDNFELIISDNDSEDKTQQICLEYIAKDKRIKYYRQQDNLGAITNFNWVFEKSAGKYFMWAAHDDIWAPTYISKCVDMLEKETNAVLCCTYIKLIDRDGYELAAVDNNFEALSLDSRRRLQSLMRASGWCTTIYGLIRREALLKTRLCQKIWGTDWCLLFELCLLGTFVRVHEPLFYYRVFGSNVSLPKAIRNIYNSDKVKIPSYPFRCAYLYTQTWIELFRIILSLPESRWKKLFLSFDTLRLYFRHWRKGIYQNHNMVFYDCHERGDRVGVLGASFFCVLFNPRCIFNYDFCCIVLETVSGTRLLMSLRKIKRLVMNKLRRLHL